MVGSKCTKTDDLADLNFSRLLNANIAIDGHAILVASETGPDPASHAVLFDDDCGWAVHGLPDNNDLLKAVPSAFRDLEKDQPYLFDSSQAAPSCLFDELGYLQF